MPFWSIFFFVGLPKNFAMRDYRPPVEVPCIVQLLCEKHEGLQMEAKEIKEHWFKPYIKKLFDKKVILFSLLIRLLLLVTVYILRVLPCSLLSMHILSVRFRLMLSSMSVARRLRRHVMIFFISRKLLKLATSKFNTA